MVYASPTAIFGLSDGGDVLAQVNGQLFRLPWNGKQWQALGSLPGPNLSVYAVGDPQGDARGDVLWAQPTLARPGSNGAIVTPVGTIYWASLP
jgi:hypothetical protein